MENILIYLSVLGALLTGVGKASTATSYRYALEAIDFAVFENSIDYRDYYLVDDNLSLAFDTYKLEENFIKVLKANLGHFKGKIRLEFFHYNAAKKLDCMANSLVCNGVEVKVVLQNHALYKERYYRYEIV